MISFYARPGWREGEPFTALDGSTADWMLHCPSCLGYHADNSTVCNGLRHRVPDRCPAVIGEVRCDRPDEHLGRHVADSVALLVEWDVKGR